jgi:hypothetical protein
MTEPVPLLFGMVTQEAAAIILSVAVAILLGWLTLRSERSLTASRVAFDAVLRTNWDKDYIEKRREFLALRRSKAGLERFAAETSTIPEAERDAFNNDRSVIQAILNDHENTAIAIRRGIIDEEYLFRYMRSGAVDDWEASSALVAALRRQTGKPIFVEFEGLATQWQKNMSYYQQDVAMPQRQRTVVVR